MHSKTIGSIVSVLFLLASLVLLDGCNNPGKGSGLDKQPNAASHKVRVEFRPPESGERMRWHIYTPDGLVELEVQIEYADGRMAYRYLRPDGTCKEDKVSFPGVKTIRSHKIYDNDGITVLSAEVFRLDGTKESSFERRADGTTATTEYYPDGRTAYCLELVYVDDSVEQTYYRKDGITVWAKVFRADSGLRVVEYFGLDGKIEQKRQERADRGINITVYRPDGTVNYVQSWWTNDQLRYFQMYLLESVTEYQLDGKIPMRQLIMSSNGKAIVKVIKFASDGAKESILYFRIDGTLEKKELLDKAGKVKATERHSMSEGIRENVDVSRLGEPTTDSPLELRNLQRFN